MSEPAKAEKPAAPKATAAAKPKSTAPLPKPIPGHSPATPALKRLRRELGEMLAGFKGRKTHMFKIYAIHVRSALDDARKVRNEATEAERRELDAMELRAQMLLIHVPGPDAKDDNSWLSIDWQLVSNTLDQLVPGIGAVVPQAPQVYRDCAEAILRSTLHVATAFAEQWVEIQKHWFEFLHATATMIALETAAIIASATPGTQLLGIIVQGLIIAFVAYAAVQIGMQAGELTTAFWQSIKDANGDPSKIDAAARHFARLVVYILRLLAEGAAGGALAKLSMKGMKRVLGSEPVSRVGDQSPVARIYEEQLKITTNKSNGIWELKIKVRSQKGLEKIADAYVLLDRNGAPDGGPSFTIDNRLSTDAKVHIYRFGRKLSLTDLVLDETLAAYTREFGHPPDTLPGSLAWENQRNFQRAYAQAIERGLPHDAACQDAIRKISFGRSRIDRGYDKFTIRAERLESIELDGMGERLVPTKIYVNARRNR